MRKEKRGQAPFPQRPRALPAFTLLEVLLAIVIITLMMGALLAFYSYAMEIRQQMFFSIDHIASQRLFMSRITDELRSTLPNSTFNGATDSLTFTTTALPVNLNPGVSSIQRVVNYSLNTSVDDQGNPIVNGLQRVVFDPTGPNAAAAAAPPSDGSTPTTDPSQASDASTAAPDPNAPPPAYVPTPTDSADLLSDAIQFVRFRYYNGTDWVDSWSDTNPPLAVEIALGESPLPQGTDPIDYPFGLSTRVIAITTSAAAATQPSTQSTPASPDGGTQ